MELRLDDEPLLYSETIHGLMRRLRITGQLFLRGQLIWTLRRKRRNRLFPYGVDINHAVIQNRVPKLVMDTHFPGLRVALKVAVVIAESSRSEPWAESIAEMVAGVRGVSMGNGFDDEQCASVVWVLGPVEVMSGFFASGSVDVPDGYAGTYFDGLTTTLAGVRPVFRPAFSATLLCAAYYMGPLVVLSVAMARRYLEELASEETFSLPEYIQWSLDHHIPWLKADGRPYRHLGVEGRWTELAVRRARPCCSGKSEAKIAVIIPSRNPELLRRCLNSFYGASIQDIGVYVIANGEQWEAVADTAKSVMENANVLRFLEGFNWARANNWAASSTHEEMLLFLNDDVEFLDDLWSERIKCNLLRYKVGIVGGKLLYPTNEIQHAGLCSPSPGLWVHKFQFAEKDDFGYMGLLQLPQEVSAVTGALLATRRQIFQRIGGFDEKYPLAYNDIDFCLRMGQEGYGVIYDPRLMGIHRESASRPRIVETESQREFLREWGNYVDPFFPLGMTRFYGFPRLNDRGLDL